MNNKMDFFKFGKTSKKVKAGEAFSLCKRASKVFDFSFPVAEDNLQYYSGEFKKSQDFTALLICASFVYLKSENQKGDELKFNPYSSEGLIFNYIPFYIDFIELVLREARQINTEMMQSCLGGGYDEDGIINDTEEYRVMMYIHLCSRVFYKYKDFDIKALSQLAYNYFEAPGILNYHDKEYHNIYDVKYLKPFSEAYDSSANIIFTDLMEAELDYYNE